MLPRFIRVVSLSINIERIGKFNRRATVNRHIGDKIRQQLQVLRDAGLLLHIGSGVWRLP
ncbi:MAG TPA: hypothetical protein DCQ92_12790 [Verrucomicrobia subdivision 3 bacterium]|nr:hypothetical protein [Limisphaerales bacterium]